jgi:hypothetical protein
MLPALVLIGRLQAILMGVDCHTSEHKYLDSG